MPIFDVIAIEKTHGVNTRAVMTASTIPLGREKAFFQRLRRASTRSFINSQSERSTPQTSVEPATRGSSGASVRRKNRSSSVSVLPSFVRLPRSSERLP